nr:unnamed protein product [Callosobruchus chinensis]
MRFSGFCYE